MKIYVFIIFVLIYHLSFAESERIETLKAPTDSSSSLVDRTAAILLIDEGKQYLNMGKSRDALTKFREALNTDRYSHKAAYWIGQTHYQMSNYGYAQKYANLALELYKDDDGEIYYLLGQSYHRRSELDSALYFYEKADMHLSKRKKKFLKVETVLEQVTFAKEMEKKSINYSKKLMEGDVNSGYDDYAPVLSSDGKLFYFVSRRPDTQGGGLNPDDQRFFEDVYRATWNETNGEWEEITNNIERLNSEGFDAVNHLSKDGLTIYLTVNTSVLDISNPTQSSDITVSEYTDQERWERPKVIRNPTINTSFFDGSATLTADENTMYFISDRRANKTGMDIYVVYKNGRSWGEAEVLPSAINTKFNETTPYISPDGRYLFFSSNGHRGMGGYDIFVSENIGKNKWTTPINLGPEFNTVNNDTHFRYYEGLARAYFASYRLQGNRASIDLFEMELEGWKIPKAKENK